jgi:hypothetical protein
VFIYFFTENKENSLSEFSNLKDGRRLASATQKAVLSRLLNNEKELV